MLTYRSFTTPIDLLRELSTKRWFLEVPEGQDPEDFEGRVQRPVRLRVFNGILHNLRHVSFFNLLPSSKALDTTRVL